MSNIRSERIRFKKIPNDPEHLIAWIEQDLEKESIMDRVDAPIHMSDEMARHSVYITIENAVSTPDVAGVTLHANIAGRNMVVQGSAKRMPGDKPNQDVALTLAVSRALTSLAAKIEKQALGKVKHADDMAVQQKLDRVKKAERKIATKKTVPVKVKKAAREAHAEG